MKHCLVFAAILLSMATASQAAGCGCTSGTGGCNSVSFINNQLVCGCGAQCVYTQSLASSWASTCPSGGCSSGPSPTPNPTPFPTSFTRFPTPFPTPHPSVYQSPTLSPTYEIDNNYDMVAGVASMAVGGVILMFFGYLWCTKQGCFRPKPAEAVLPVAVVAPVDQK